MKNEIACLIVSIFLFVSSSMILADEPSEGQLAPEFSIKRLDGSEFKLSNLKGKKSAYVVFWNTWCTYCMKKIPKLKKTQSELNQQIEIIAINTGLKDSLEKTMAFKNQFDINYPLAFDYDKRVTDMYGVWGTPTEFIIDINGIIQHRDGIPDDIQLHLSQWNSVSIDSANQKVVESCTSEKRIC